MKKIVSVVFVVLLLVLSVVFAAKPIGSESKKTLKIPSSAKKISENVYYLGKAKDKGNQVEGYAIIKYKKNNVKPGTVCGNGICEPGENVNKCPDDCGGGDIGEDSSCYGFLSKGTKWKSVESYMIDPQNSEGISDESVSDIISLSTAKWETAAQADIFGNEEQGFVDGADTISPDGKNEVMFGGINDSNAIAVTIVWGVFGGPPKSRYLVEWDMIFNEVDFDWSSYADPSRMDFENIATHELGHSAGLKDLYTAECSEQTMYGYSTEGETKKQSLETGDITGIRLLYQ